MNRNTATSATIGTPPCRAAPVATSAASPNTCCTTAPSLPAALCGRCTGAGAPRGAEPPGDRRAVGGGPAAGRVVGAAVGGAGIGAAVGSDVEGAVGGGAGTGAVVGPVVGGAPVGGSVVGSVVGGVVVGGVVVGGAVVGGGADPGTTSHRNVAVEVRPGSLPAGTSTVIR